MKLEQYQGLSVVSSLELAESLDRTHYNVLQNIDRLIETRRNAGLPLDAEIFSGSHEHPYNGRSDRCYFLSRSGAMAFALNLRKEPERSRLIVDINQSF